VTASRTTASPPPELCAVASALPEPVSQDDVAAFAASLAGDLAERAAQVFANAGISHRHLARPIEWYGEQHAPGARFEMACVEGVALGTSAAQAALDRSGTAPHDVDTLLFVSTTTVRAPSLDVSLAATLGLRDDVRRVPIFGLASLGGAAGLALAADLIRGGDQCVLVVACELNSFMFVPGEPSMESLVTTALFSDGAAAAVVKPAGSAGDDDACVALLARHTTLVPDSLAVMGFDPTDQGLRWRLAPDVPDVALASTAASVGAALARVGWSLADVDHVLVHPGGAKVLDAVEVALGLAPGALEWSRRTMAEHGNISSVTVLLVLEAFLRSGPAPGHGLLTAMGPGFAFEHVLFDVVA
jgi:alkylresorcinol/alkylpyrone synthase